jgi:1-acyl-sn-glycerol-3-phosphate acyltransferase
LIRNIRAAYRLVAFLGATIVLYAIWYIGRVAASDKTKWRQWFLDRWTASFARISKMRIEVTGLPPEPPFFLVTNHLSYADIGALRRVVNGVFVAKAEVSRWFFAGPIVRDAGTIFIDRSQRRDIPRAGEEILQRLADGEGVVVFPEGTSTAGHEVLPFNSSFFEFAARADIPVSYAAIAYRTPGGELPASTVVCWGDNISFFAHLWRLLKLPQYTAVISFGDELVKSADRKELAAELHRRVVDKFVPVDQQ